MSQEISKDSLAQLTALAERYVAYEVEVEAAENALKEAKARMTALREEDIPALMTELGVNLIKLEDGTKVEVKDEVYCGISEANKEPAFAWLEEHEFGGIIKTSIALQFGKDELETAMAAFEKIRELGYEAQIARSVHASTLKAFVKEQLEKAAELPLELFGARSVKQAKFTKVKK